MLDLGGKVSGTYVCERLKETDGIRDSLLYLAERISRGHGYLQLQAEIVHQRNILMRLQGDVKGSERIIEDLLSNMPNSQTARREITGPLYLSQVINHSYNFLFQRRSLYSTIFK